MARIKKYKAGTMFNAAAVENLTHKVIALEQADTAKSQKIAPLEETDSVIPKSLTDGVIADEFVNKVIQEALKREVPALNDIIKEMETLKERANKAEMNIQEIGVIAHQSNTQAKEAFHKASAANEALSVFHGESQNLQQRFREVPALDDIIKEVETLKERANKAEVNIQEIGVIAHQSNTQANEAFHSVSTANEVLHALKGEQQNLNQRVFDLEADADITEENFAELQKAGAFGMVEADTTEVHFAALPNAEVVAIVEADTTEVPPNAEVVAIMEANTTEVPPSTEVVAIVEADTTEVPPNAEVVAIVEADTTEVPPNAEVVAKVKPAVVITLILDEKPISVTDFDGASIYVLNMADGSEVGTAQVGTHNVVMNGGVMCDYTEPTNILFWTIDVEPITIRITAI